MLCINALSLWNKGELWICMKKGESLLLLLFLYNYALKIVVYLWLNCHRSCVQIDPKSSNDEKMSIWNFGTFHQFLSNLKLTYLVTLFYRNLQLFKISPKWTIFDIFDECDFFCDFQTLCL